jgi:GH18 family chitinase
VSGTVTGYRVYEGSTVRATVTGTSTTLSGLGACSSHSYTVAAYNSVGESARSAAVPATTTGCPTGGGPLTGGAHASTIAAIRAAGGDVIPSIGGWSGNKLGPNCSTPQALAGAYQQVINTFNLKAIDVDVENFDEFENPTVQDRILNALKIVKQNNPAVKTIITFGTTTSGPSATGIRLINQAAALQANIDVFTIMPYDFNGHANMYQNTVNASEGLKNALKAAFGWSDAVAYSRMGISGMNGLSDQQELTDPATWTQIRD